MSLYFRFARFLLQTYGFPGGSDSKASACNAGDTDSTPESGRSPGEGSGNPLQYSCLENPMDGGAWWATVHGVARSRTRLSDFTFFFHPYLAWQVALVVKNPPANAGDTEMWIRSLGLEDPLAVGMATHSSILAWRIL